MTYLLDTNLLVYPHDRREVEKRARAREVLDRLAEGGRAVLPAQALAEFANVTLRKFAFDPGEVQAQLAALSRSFPVLPLTEPTVLEAVRGVRDHQLSYYDAQVWAVAKLNHIPTVLSEDFPSGATVEDVTFLNPLETTFDLAELA